MKLGLVKVVLMLIITRYKGMVDGVPGASCYMVSHDKYSPNWKYHIPDDFSYDDKATAKTCQDWCTQDVNCRSVLYKIDEDEEHYCTKFNISIQELKDTGRDNEIYNATVHTYITYDRECGECRYPVSHDRVHPQWSYSIDSKNIYFGSSKTCKDWCNQDVNCRSVTYIVSKYRWQYCIKFKISVQELKDTERYVDIYTETEKDMWSYCKTYDRDCAQLPGTKCTNKYPVSHDRERPKQIYRIEYMRDDNATAKTCQDFCNKDVNCRSVLYIIDGGERNCTTFRISVQELKFKQIFNVIALTYITYDRDCAVVPGAMCIYPVSHDRKAPDWEFYRIDDDYLRDDNATKETCWDYCNENENCRSALHIIHGDGRGYCYRYSISVQELKDTGMYIDIYTETDTKWAPTYITYDRDCGECTYPVSHDNESPKEIYRIDKMSDPNATPKTCQIYCTKDVNCRSVLYYTSYREGYCTKYKISVQELKDTGRDDETFTGHWSRTHITYDRDCADPPSSMCSNEYPVSHRWESPYDRIYLIEYLWVNKSKPETCKDWCNEDVNCRSVLYVIYWEGSRRCFKYSISVKELKDTGRYNEIWTEPSTSVITYDKQCVQSFRFTCTNKYPVSHHWESPDYNLYIISWMIHDSTTAKTCWDYCTKDVNCRSVTYEINHYGRRYCHKYNTSLQELKDMGRDDEIEAFVHTFITYDKGGCEYTYPVSHDRESPFDLLHFIDKMSDPNATAKTCQHWCNKDGKCSSVRYMIKNDGWSSCTKFSISVQELKDRGRYREIVTVADTNRAPTYITYDRNCEYTYPVSHDRQSPASYLKIGTQSDDNATAETCWDYCNEDVTCRSVALEISGGVRYCTKFSITVQELKESGRDNEIYNATVPTYITYDRDCVEVSTATKGPGTDVDEVSPATKGPGTNVAAIGEPMIVLIVMIGAGAVLAGGSLWCWCSNVTWG